MFNQYEDHEEIAAHEAEWEFHCNMREALDIDASYPRDKVCEQASAFIAKYYTPKPGDTMQDANIAYISDVIDTKAHWARATGIADAITPKQLASIRNTAKDWNIEPAVECGKLFGCTVTELSRKGAAELITHLEQLKRAMSVVRAA